jgi:hypothetical protein
MFIQMYTHYRSVVVTTRSICICRRVCGPTLILTLASYILCYIKVCTPWRHIVGIEVQLHSFFTITLDGGEWPISHPDNFTPGMNPGTHSVGGCGGGGRNDGLNGLEKLKILCLCQNSNPSSSSPQRSLYLDDAIPSPIWCHVLDATTRHFRVDVK